MILCARSFRFNFPGPTLIMGVVNVTPDSFSDGGQFFEARAAIEHGLKLVKEGADILDVGGESTRPGAQPVPESEELRRVLPVIEALAKQSAKPISVDTVKPTVARKAIAAGASIINDVAANRDDPEMWRVAAESGAGYVLMHMQGTPQTMQCQPQYEDVVSEVGYFFEDRLGRLREHGVSSEQVMLDVGIGFGKTAQHNLELLRALRGFAKWERPLVLGVSRKSFIGNVTDTVGVTALAVASNDGCDQTAKAVTSTRLPGSLACACWAVAAGVQIIRTHDVAATQQAIRMTEAILGAQKECLQ
jgi:dihydropteroate synthase